MYNFVDDSLYLEHWFHTSARRNNVSGSKFEWCPSNQAPTSNLWAADKPGNLLSEEYSAKVFIDERTSERNTLTDTKPNYLLRFICE
jgi:hypothetical protein